MCGRSLFTLLLLLFLSTFCSSLASHIKPKVTVSGLTDVNGSVFQLEEPEQMKGEVVSNDESAGGLPVCKATLSKNYSILF